MIKGARILIVDDEQPIRMACAKILTEEGAKVEIAEDGLKGLEKAKEGEFELALIDLKMPIWMVWSFLRTSLNSLRI